MKKTQIKMFAAIGCLLLLLPPSGCGGKSPVMTPLVQTATGRAVVSVTWPERKAASRLIPAGANSIKITFLSGTSVVKTTSLVRPNAGSLATSAVIADLPKGTLTVQVAAYQDTDTSGNPLAIAQSTVVITPGQTSNVPLTLVTTINSVSFSPIFVSFTTAPVTLTASALDSAGNSLAGAQWQWTNSNAQVIALVPNGDTATIQAIGVGSATITLTETESGRTFAHSFIVTTTN